MDLPPDLQLGYYGLHFKGADGKDSFGQDDFFRVGIQAPEFRVSVKRAEKALRRPTNRDT